MEENTETWKKIYIDSIGTIFRYKDFNDSMEFHNTKS